MTRFNRREPWSRFILTLGAADMVIGSVGHSGSLFSLGLTTVGVGLLVRWARLKPRASFLEQGTKVRPALASGPSSNHRQDSGRRPRERRIY